MQVVSFFVHRIEQYIPQVGGLNKQTNTMAEVMQSKIEPQYFLNGDIDQTDKYLTTLDLCYAVQDVVGNESYRT